MRPHEVERYVAELSRLVQDPAARQAMGKAGRQRIADRFQLRHMVERMQGVLAEASQLHAAAPRPQPSPGLGLACASQAVEYGRLSQFADSLWQEREAGRSVPDSQFGHTPRRVSVYFTLRRFLLPLLPRRRRAEQAVAASRQKPAEARPPGRGPGVTGRDTRPALKNPEPRIT